MVDVTADDPAADWTAPGVFEVASGVFRIPLPLPTDGLRAVNVYAVADGEDLVLVDSGWAIPQARELLERGLTNLGRDLAEVRRFLITHIHQDHYTQAVTVRREFGTPVALGKGEQSSLDIVSGVVEEDESPYVRRLRAADAQPVLRRLSELGERPRNQHVWEPPDEWLSDRAATPVGARELQAIETPGHTRGHLVYVERAAGLLFAGDHVLPHITPSIGFEAAPAEFPLRDYLNSLKLVRALPDMTLLPAHGPVTPSAHARVDELLEHHDARLEACYRTIERGATTAYESAGRLTWTRRERTVDELDTFNAMLAVLETMSHLDVLVLQERLRVSVVDDVKHYRCA